jgi:hypothetical protein
MEDAPNRRAALAHLAFAGLIDVQDRMLHNRSYTTGHKSYRARATIELGEAIGWDAAHHVLYAGVPDIAVGPRWYSTYEMGCNVVQNLLDGRDRELLAQKEPLTAAEEALLVDAIVHQREPSVIAALVALLKSGRSPRRILDAIQVAAAQVSTATSTATPSAGSTTPSITRTGSSCCSSRRPSSTTAPTIRPARLATDAGRSPSRRAPTRCRRPGSWAG